MNLPKAGKRFQIFAAIFLLSASGGKAESLEEAMFAAWQTNPQLLATRQGFLSISTDVQSAFADWLPQADLALRYGASQSVTELAQPTNNQRRISDRQNPWSARMTVTQNIFRGGRIIAGVAQARSNREAAYGDLISAEQLVLLSVATAYFDLLRDEAVVRLRQNNVSVLRNRLSQTRNRFRVGEGTRTLVAFAEARVSAARTQLAAAQADLVASQAAYLRVVGRKPIGRLRFARLPAVPKSRDQVRQSARQNHPALISARERYNTANTAKTAAYGLFLPTLSVEGVYTQSGEQTAQIDSSTSLSINGRFNLPIYRGGRSFASVRKASHEAERARFNLIDQERQIDEMVTNAWQGLRTARAQIISASEQVKASKIALDGIRQQQSLGTGTFLDSLDSEQAYLDAQVSLVTARRDEYVAAYGLLSASGLLTAERLNLERIGRRK